MTPFVLGSLFHVDRLALIMMGLVAFIGLCVGSFARHYLKGDSYYRSFFGRLTLLVGTVMVMVSADNLLLLLLAWCASNALLVQLMMHKTGWRAARAAGVLASRNFALGAAGVAGAFGLFYATTGQASIQAVLQEPALTPPLLLALGLLLIGAMTQSAIWPFHRWLLSSLNSPTPVSAIMHAGLINGGGFLLARFAPLYLRSPDLLTVLVVLGFLTALLGTLWKLMQPDVKRMLACSTMGQMGFMFVQCGLGLFPAAVAHLVWHGLFKAYLFLSSGSAAKEKRVDQAYPPTAVAFVAALACGLAGSFSFAAASGKQWLATDSTLVLIAVAFLTTSQFALPLLQVRPLHQLPGALLGASLFGLVYGGSVQLIGWLLAPLNLQQPQPLSAYHVAGLLALTLAWLTRLFFSGQPKDKESSTPNWLLKGYVQALNASQPHPATITTHRNQYHF
ncbi:proton-conducting transporter transmembrane domain-containing protein [Hymenobacter rigui]|uniref:Proton-conducting membrane transporter n=1 Tax=Hymenobacter rigui TaxID=334424 RepID=A0A428KAC0_9BACT|nr:proton-conducting transporter membrane subunit [Hymenobacter rigui]RSK43170.1 proton-conducting membrane transporter [Hymenobacter rigui]